MSVAFHAVEAAAALLAGHAHQTPVLTSQTVDAQTGASVFFKCENFQRMGAFKFRGAYHALARLPDEARQRGVVAYSSGNHAQAVALAGRMLGIAATIVMPDDAPRVKLEATRAYGARIVTYDRNTQEREALAAELAARERLTTIPPFDHPDVIAGQGTAALELLRATGPLDYLLVPCGGGGLLSGSAIAASGYTPGIKVIGVEPAAGDDVTRSFRSGTLQSVENPQTIADGARTTSAGKYTFPLIQAYVHDMLTVTDEELLRSMFFLMERMKFVPEPTGVLGAAALLSGKLDVRGKRVGVIISGGNVDLFALAPYLARGRETYAA
ncbi:threo-3-hydroxy-L-aspartate ammonia-lyase [Pigmentiphaga sp.]|uniref:threo-3-hydroxy-L-aspartate ammonia-lyase n=1 Tax=Pigmentiphaga sp. TaxID=1977564 RepID=UPI0025D3A83D|nr:threo-3-hydroxy-L-aspartate ammonia-lyase [Pigmentiphaga sp.]MBX6316914.1 threo-3-hydroxy-L-aspartate ammonia-lyase [Pigmentiphaga sp.]